MSDNFLNSYNVMNILRQASVYAIMATGMTFVILTGGIDLGQGSVLALAAVVCAKVINATGNMWLGILSAVAVGVVIGGINGVMIAYVRLPAFIMTLGSLYMVRVLRSTLPTPPRSTSKVQSYSPSSGRDSYLVSHSQCICSSGSESWPLFSSATPQQAVISLPLVPTWSQHGSLA